MILDESERDFKSPNRALTRISGFWENRPWDRFSRQNHPVRAARPITRGSGNRTLYCTLYGRILKTDFPTSFLTPRTRIH